VTLMWRAGDVLRSLIRQPDLQGEAADSYCPHRVRCRPSSMEGGLRGRRLAKNRSPTSKRRDEQQSPKHDRYDDGEGPTSRALAWAGRTPHLLVPDRSWTPHSERWGSVVVGKEIGEQGHWCKLIDVCAVVVHGFRGFARAAIARREPPAPIAAFIRPNGHAPDLR